MRLIYASLFIFTVFCVGGEIWSRSDAYDSQLQQSRIAAQNISQAAINHADATLDTASWALDDMVERVESGGVTRSNAERLQEFLRSRVQKSGSPLQGLFVTDALGTMVVSTDTGRVASQNFSDRDYFTYHRSHTNRDVYIGPPIVDRSSRERVLPVSRRLDDSSGKFAGVALVTVPIRYFERYYQKFTTGQHGTLVLATSDGTVLTGTPGKSGAERGLFSSTELFRHIGRAKAQSGSLMMRSSVDQIERLHSYRYSTHYPLVFSVGFGRDEILSAWWDITIQECSVVATMLAATFLGGFWLISQLRAREVLEKELRQAHSDLAGRNAELVKLAHTDGLTGLHNRRFLDQTLQTELARSSRDGSPVALLLIDVDHFKRYNDTYGHIAGDDCLRSVADCIIRHVRRPGDMAARYGGEEFAVLLPGAGPEGALAIAESLCQVIRDLQIPHQASSHSIVTVSIGVASLCSREPDTLKGITRLADAALYKAKETGRNRAHIAPLLDM